MIPRAERNDRRIETAGDADQDRTKLRGPCGDAIQNQLPQGVEIGGRTMYISPGRPAYRLFGPALADFQRHARQKLMNAREGGCPLGRAVDLALGRASCWERWCPY